MSGLVGGPWALPQYPRMLCRLPPYSFVSLLHHVKVYGRSIPAGTPGTVIPTVTPSEKVCVEFHRTIRVWLNRESLAEIDQC